MIPQHIRLLFERRFGKKIIYSKDCEVLSKNIEKVCQEKISPTTIKRLFGFAKSIDQPRTYTLDVLANYVGFINWSTLLAKMEQADSFLDTNIQTLHTTPINDIHLLHHQISISLTTQSINIDSFTSLCKQFGHQAEIFPFITEMISIAARQKNIIFLSKVFKQIDVFQDKPERGLGYYYIGQTMGLMLRTHPDIADALIPILAGQPNARAYFIEWFVDEDYLTGYYGRLLDAYYLKQKRSPQSSLFYYCLKYQQAKELELFKDQIEYFKKLKSIEINDKFHAIIIGRYVGILILNESKSDTFETEYWDWILDMGIRKPYDEAISFLFYLIRALYDSNRYKMIVRLIDNFEQYHGIWDMFNRSKNHWGIKIENQLRIYASFYFLQIGNKKSALYHFKKIDSNYFDPFIYNQMNVHYIKVQALLKKQVK
jgi:hypothetical protein